MSPIALRRAPAKLTCCLHVLGVRADGFHTLEALTVAVAPPADRVEVAPGRGLTVTGPAAAGVPRDDGNLVRRALVALGADAAVALHKVIPAGAGLGGGSSDAAAVLAAARDVLGLAVDDAHLHEVAAALGSDVPFSLAATLAATAATAGAGPGTGYAAWMRGRGEVLEPVALAAPLHVVLAVPPFGCSTPAVYRAWDDLGGPQSERRLPAPPALAPLAPELRNDLEPAAEHVEPRLRSVRDEIEAAAGRPALLAGSGSSHWIPCTGARDAEATARALGGIEGLRVWAAEAAAFSGPVSGPAAGAASASS